LEGTGAELLGNLEEIEAAYLGGVVGPQS
jgi:hypothetical protein